jgi:hypothetical protein
MNKIPTAELLALQIESTASYEELVNPIIFASLVAKEFAKIHVNAALQAASEQVEFDEEVLIRQSILQAYPLDLIK